MKRIGVWAVVVLVLAPFTACDGGDPSGTGGSGGGGAGGDGMPQGTSLFAEIIDASGNVLPDIVAVFDENEDVVTTNGAGQVLLENLASGRVVRRIEAPGHAPASLVAELPPGVHAGIRKRLVPLGAKQTFNDQDPTVLTAPGVVLSLEADSLMFEDGLDVTGMVEAQITVLDPTAVDPALVPAPLEGTRINGAEVSLAPFSLVEISVWQNGSRLQLKPGKPAMVELVIPAALDASAPEGEHFRGFWLDLDAGTWKEDTYGVIQKYSQDATKKAWLGELPHFTWWTDAAEFSDKNCFSVTLKDRDGAPWPGQKVDPIPLNFDGLPMPKYTGENGNTCVNIKYLSQAKLKAGSDTAVPIGEASVTGAGLASACGVVGVSCQPVEIQSQVPRICTPGEKKTCTYSGDPAKLGKGICVAGTDYCNADGTAWLGCQGEVLPRTETCDTVFDDDCDGVANEGGTNCNCTPGMTKAGGCYTAAPLTLGVGVCIAGTSTCNKSGTGYVCKNEVIPSKEICTIAGDEDCDGSTACSFWSKRFGNDGDDQALGIIPDANGNVIVIGRFLGTLNFGLQEFVNPDPNWDTFVVKLDPAGNLLWAKQLGDTGTTQGANVAIHPSGDIIIGGRCEGIVDFGLGAQTCPVGGELFLARLDAATGSPQWAKVFAAGANLFYAYNQIDIDSLGNILVAGSYDGSAAIGVSAPALPASNAYDVFVAKLDGNGTHIWSQAFSGPADDHDMIMAVDGNDNVVIGGHFVQTLTVGGTTLTAPANVNGWVAKLDGMTGTPMWSRSFDSATNVYLTWVDTDANNDVIIASYFDGTMTLSNVPAVSLTAQGGADGVIVKLSGADGSHIWSKQISGPGTDLAASVSVDSQNNIWGSGHFQLTADIAGQSLTSAGPYDVFAVKLDASGSVLDARRFGGSGDEQTSVIRVDPTGAALMVMSTKSKVLDLGNGPYFGAGDPDIDVAIVRMTP